MTRKPTQRLTILVSLSLLSAALASAPASADLAQKRSATTSELAKVQSELKSNLTSDAAVQALASRTQIALTDQQVRVDQTQLAQTEATAQVVQADRQLAGLARKTSAAHRHLVATAVAAYTNPESPSGGDLAQLVGRGLKDYGIGQAYLSATNSGIQNSIDAYRLDQSALQAARVSLITKQKAAAAVARAAVGQENRLQDVMAAQRAAQAGLGARIADLRQESADLTSQQGQITALIEAQAAADAARLAAARTASAAARTGSPPRSDPVAHGPVSNYGLVWPIHGVVTSEYGPRWGGFHPGIDIATAYGTPIEASNGGVVVYAGYDGGFGNFVCIDHGGGLSTCYAHQSQIAVSVGQSVFQGQTIGYEGSTGDSTGPHVHFEVRINGATQNPRDYLSGNP